MVDASDIFAQLIVETFRLNGQLIAAGDELVTDLKLSSARWQVMGALHLSQVPLPVAHIARNMGLSRQGVQRLVKEMAADGLLRLAPNPHHQRAKLVMLTGAGKDAFAHAMQRQVPWARQISQGISDTRLRATLRVLSELRRRLESKDHSEGDL